MLFLFNVICANPAIIYNTTDVPAYGAPGVSGSWREELFIFRELVSTGYYFRGVGEQAHSFGGLGSPAKK